MRSPHPVVLVFFPYKLGPTFGPPPKTIIRSMKVLSPHWCHGVKDPSLQIAGGSVPMISCATSSQPNRVNWSMNHFLSFWLMKHGEPGDHYHIGLWNNSSSKKKLGSNGSMYINTLYCNVHNLGIHHCCHVFLGCNLKQTHSCEDFREKIMSLNDLGRFPQLKNSMTSSLGGVLFDIRWVLGRLWVETWCIWGPKLLMPNS